MKATDLLERQHEEVKALFKRLESTQKAAEQRQIFEELASNLVGHDAIERQVFYPACEKAMGMTDLLGEALVEHGVVEFMLYEADEALGDDDFKYKCTVLKETLEHHIEEEESEFFPEAEKALGDDKLDALGKQMERKFEQSLKEDFRKPLRNNLKQVLAGTIKPAPGRNGARRNGARRNGAQRTAAARRKKSTSRTASRAAR